MPRQWGGGGGDFFFLRFAQHMLRPRAPSYIKTDHSLGVWGEGMALAVPPPSPSRTRKPEEVLWVLEMRERLMLAGLKRVRDQITVVQDLSKARMVLRRRRRRPPPVSAPSRLRVPMKRRVKKVPKDVVCPVCQDDLGTDAFQTACSHAFHAHCLERWAAERYDNPTCPVCRQMLFLPS